MSADIWFHSIKENSKFGQLFCVLVLESALNMSESSEPATSSSETTSSTEAVVDKTDDFVEPDCKRRKLNHKNEKKFELEDRLGGILCCAVCLDLPKTAVYQVSYFEYFIATHIT